MAKFTAFSASKMNEIKLLTDSMFGRLTRLLRIFGYDTVYANDLENYFKVSPVPDDLLLKYALEHDRIVITRDYPFFKKNKKKIIYLEGEGVYHYLNHLKKKLHLEYDFVLQKARCSVCNSSLEKVMDKKEIINEVKSQTFKFYDDFYQCTNESCRKIYWEGTHIDKIMNQLKN